MNRWNQTGFVMVLALVCAPVARAEAIQVKGQTIQAGSVEYYHDGLISNFVVETPVELKLARANHIVAGDLVYIYQNGDPSLVASAQTQDLDWQTADGRTVALNCDTHPVTRDFPAHPRLVTFHQGGEYKAGCEARQPVSFTSDELALTVRGELETSPVFGLQYAQEVISGTVRVGEQNVTAKPGTSVAFYPNGGVRYLTPVAGESFTRTHPRYGAIRFAQAEAQPMAKDVAMTFYDNGAVEGGILGQTLPLTSLGIEIPMGSGVVFANDPGMAIQAVIFATPVRIKAPTVEFAISRILLDPATMTFHVTIAEDFTFVNPDNGALLPVPARSQVVMTIDRSIVEIESPSPRVASAESGAE